MTAAVAWIGSLGALTLLVSPVAARRLGARDQDQLADGIQPRLESLGWFCLVLMVATGLFQMSANDNYRGLVGLENTWEAAIVTKLGLVLLLGLTAAWISWGVRPGIQRAKLHFRKTGEMGEVGALRRKERVLVALQVAIAVIILLATAVARTASQ
jgi:putative copper export protein